MKVIALLSGVAAVVSVLAPTAAATTPAHSHQTVPVSVVYEPCGVVEDVTYEIDRTRFFDEGGVVRTLLRISFAGTLTVPRTGEVLTERGNQTIVIDADGTFSFSGVSFNVHVPGKGSILLEAGRLVIDAEGNVLHQSAQTTVDLEAKVCAVLG
jgi:hypothetical protein